MRLTPRLAASAVAAAALLVPGLAAGTAAPATAADDPDLARVQDWLAERARRTWAADRSR